MVLHCLSGTHREPAFRDCLTTAGDADTILLLGEGVYNALPGSAGCNALQAHPATVYLLRSDAKALGVGVVDSPFQLADMADFVALTEACPRQLAWY